MLAPPHLRLPTEAFLAPPVRSAEARARRRDIPLEPRAYATIGEVNREAWNALYEGELERYDYLQAIEAAGLAGFEYFYLGIYRGGELVAAAPCFVTAYSLDTTLNSLGRRAIAAVRGIFRNAFVLRLAGLGSPCTETALIRVSPRLGAAEQLNAMRLLIKTFWEQARKRDCGLLAVKDLPLAAPVPCMAALRECGFARTAGMAGAYLTIDFPDVDGYLARLTPGTRKDMRRKLRARRDLRVERHTNVDPLLKQIHALYQETYARAELKFEELTADYFDAVLKVRDCKPSCVLYFHSDALVGANLLLESDGVLLDKFFCMRSEARRLNLYFVSWFENVAYCLERGIGLYYSGQAGYANKVRLGSSIAPAFMFFRHRNPAISAVLRLLAPLLSSDLDD